MKKIINFRQNSIVYTISGNGPALVLLHGFLESKAIWDGFTETLQKFFTVIAVDLPGHGESRPVAGSHTMQLMAGTVKEVLEAEKIDKIVIAGHSMGGYVALQFAVDYEEMVKGLVLFHSHADADTDETKENRSRTISIVKQNKIGFISQFFPGLFDQEHVGQFAEAIQKLRDMADLMTPDAIIAALTGMRDRPGHSQFLSETIIPVLFIIGKQDSRMPYNQMIAQAILPSHSEILLLEDVGHMGFIEAPGKTLQALMHFAERCFEE